MSTTSEPLSNTLAPSTAATLTIRVIKSFEYRTSKNLILHNIDLTATNVGQLRALIIESKTQGRTFALRISSEDCGITRRGQKREK
jgi:hypothetical protein